MNFEQPNLQKNETDPNETQPEKEKTDSYLQELDELKSTAKYKEIKKGMKFVEDRREYPKILYSKGKLNEFNFPSPEMEAGANTRLASNELSEIQKLLDSNAMNASGVEGKLKRALETLESAGVANRRSVKKRLLKIVKNHPDNILIDIAREFYRKNPESEENNSNE